MLSAGFNPEDSTDANAVKRCELANTNATSLQIGAEGLGNGPPVCVLVIFKPPAAERLACGSGSAQARVHSLSDHRPLEFGEYAHHLKHGLAGGRRCIEALLMQKKVDAESVNFRQKGYEVLKGTAEPVNRPRHHHAEAPSRSILAERIEAGTLVSRLRSAHAFVAIDLNNSPAHTLGDLAKFTLLVLGGLMVG